MTVPYATLYMPGSSQGIQVVEGSQLHLIYVAMGANSVPSAPGETVRADPFPQYVDDDELAAALSGLGPGGTSYTDTQAVDAVEAAAAVAPTGAWDFTQAPTVAGVPLGSGTVSSVNGETGAVVLDAADVGARPASYTPSIADLPAGSTLTVQKSGGTWPARPTSRADVFVQWKGADPSPAVVTSGTGGMRDGIDTRFVTP